MSSPLHKITAYFPNPFSEILHTSMALNCTYCRHKSITNHKNLFSHPDGDCVNKWMRQSR